jgi:type IV pilus assembly protein PilA
MREMRSRLHGEDGFTLIELMTVVMVLGVLLAVALPTFRSATERAQDSAAEADLRTAVVAAKSIYSGTGDFSAVTIAEMREAEPTMRFVARNTPSSAANGYAVSFRVWNFGEVDMARLSASGDCYYIRTIEEQGFAPSDEPGTYYGWRSMTCTGDQVASFGTTPVSFPGW